ncbi:NYN domain-containing protein [Lachnospiraceae bacterium G41]|nr:NYN domain-containing protein [Lachnospiraceae bacterium G41]
MNIINGFGNIFYNYNYDEEYDENYDDNYDENYDEEVNDSRFYKKNTMVFIDAESVAANRGTRIIGQCRNIGEIYEIRYYARQKDPSTEAWKDVAKEYGIKPILMCGEARHNKIDEKIIKDIYNVLENNKAIDIFCIASRDGDFSNIAKELRDRHKRVVVLATKNTSTRLKSQASEIKGI